MATLLRAEGAAILALQDGAVRTLFSHRIDDTVAWLAVLGEDALQRALIDRGGFTVAIPAQRWGESVGYALVAPITSTGPDRGVLCAMRHGLPFDAVEVVAGEAAARLLAMAFADAQAAALAGRDGPAELSEAGRAGPPETGRVAAALRVVIVESQPATRLGLETILGRGGVTVAMSCSTVAEALAGLSGIRCDVALVGTPGDAAAGDAMRLLRERASPPVVAITDTRHRSEGRALLRAGASGQLGRDAAPATILAALHAAAAGLTALDPSLLREALSRPDGEDPPADPVGASTASAPRDEQTSAAQAERDEAADPRAARTGRPLGDALSPRERELLRYLAEGYTNKEIARVMVLADDTVKKGVQSLIAKLGATDRTHAVVLALRSGLIQ